MRVDQEYARLKRVLERAELRRDRAEVRENNRLRCEGKTRKDGSPCQCVAIRPNGRCKWHGALSTGARTPEGRAKAIAVGTKNLRAWNEKQKAITAMRPPEAPKTRPYGGAKYWTPEGRARVAEKLRRRWAQWRADKEETARWDAIYAVRRQVATLTTEELLALAPEEYRGLVDET